MLRGQSQPRSQSARRVLGRCKNKENFGSGFCIDVDNGSVDVIVVDVPETSQQRPRCFRASRRDSCPSGVINIDDEEEDVGGAPTDVCGGPIGNSSCPGSSKSPACGEWESEERLKFKNNGIFPKASRKKVRMYPQFGSSRNRFGLGLESKSSSSESDSSEFVISESDSSDTDSSDCEIVEDTSGDIRVQWERAAYRKKMKDRGQYDFEDQVSASGSSADPACPAHETTQEKVDGEYFGNCTSSKQFEAMPVDSSQNGSLNVKENLSFAMPMGDAYGEHPLPTTKEDRLFADLNFPASFYHDESFFGQTEKFTPDHRDQSMGETSDYHRRAGSVELEMPDEPTFDQTENFTSDHRNQSKGETSDCHKGPVSVEQEMPDEPIFDQTEKFASDYRDQSMGETSDCHRGAGPVELEIPEPDFSMCNLRSGYDQNAKEDGLNFWDKEVQVPVENLYFASDFQFDTSFEGIAGSCMGEQSRSNPQTCSAGLVPPATVGHGNKEERFTLGSSCGTVSQNDSHPNLEEVELKEENNKERSLNTNQPPDDKHVGSEDVTEVQNDLIGDREKHKESDEYRRATEEEWASRQRELQIQAEEAQRLRKRKKTETLRLLDIEKRQRQRVEEVRELQKKDQETIDLKEQFRVEVRKELDIMERRFKDMASLLRGLGIQVKGGRFPMTDEVNAAYKQALLRFHPDRASGKGIRQQVEAEETFKLISRLKEKLLRVA